MKKLIRITTVPLSIEKLLGKQLTFMNQFYNVTAISADKNELKKVAENLGISYFHVEMSRKITPFKDLKSVWEMYKFLKKEKPEIVHTHTPKAGLVGMLASRFVGVRNRLHTVAGLPLMEEKGLKRIILILVEKLTYACATNIYPNSNGLKDFILQKKLTNTKKIKVIGNGSSNGIDLQYFNPGIFSEKEKEDLRKEIKISPDDFVFIFVGRLVKDKGINELVSVFSTLESKIKDHSESTSKKIKLLLVGALEHDLDPLLPKTLDLIQKNKNIISVGFQSDVRPYFTISDVLVFPSYREGFPNVVLQSLAMEIPAIVTDINGCNEIITDNYNGLIVKPGNEESLENAMCKFIKDETLQRFLKKNSRKSIIKFGQTEVWEALLQEYQNL